MCSQQAWERGEKTYFWVALIIIAEVHLLLYVFPPYFNTELDIPIKYSTRFWVLAYTVVYSAIIMILYLKSMELKPKHWSLQKQRDFFGSDAIPKKIKQKELK